MSRALTREQSWTGPNGRPAAQASLVFGIDRLGALFGILVLFGLTVAVAGGEEWLKYDPATVTLAGTVSIREAFGPPGYGENPRSDRKERYFLLTLDAPVSVEGSPHDVANARSETGVTAVQMVFSDTCPFKRKWRNKHVWVSGRLFHAITGHHRTPVLIQVTGVRR